MVAVQAGLLGERVAAARRRHREARGPAPLSTSERRAIVRTFQALIEGLYVHLPQKRAGYGFDPLQRLRLLSERAADPELTDAMFHRELSRIFTDLRDAHTRYMGPLEHADQAMFLPLMVERFQEADGTRGFLASKVAAVAPGDEERFRGAGFESGVELTHWNGVRIHRAVELYAANETGGRPHARIARALESLTMRPLRYAVPPDEDWVDIRYLTALGAAHEIRLHWERVTLSPADPPAAGTGGAYALAYDPVADSAREVKKMLFAGPVWLAENRTATGPGATVRQNAAAGWREDRSQWLTGRFAANVAAKEVSHGGTSYGYLRIYSFQLQDDQAFIAEVIALIAELPARGLIVDLRANPGGLIWAAEGLLQLFTPNRIRPTRFSMAATDLTRALASASQNRSLSAWSASLEDAVATGASHSRSVPLTPLERCNNIGQRYGGPVLAIVDANTYSAGDLFAAGFVDNDIGRLVCTDAATGGGGANVWTPREVARALAGTGYEMAEHDGVSFTVSARRAERIGDAGIDLEDVGVTSPFRRPLTRRDLVDGNTDLLDYACRLLATEVVTGLSVEAAGRDLHVTVDGLSLVQLHVDGVVATAVTPDERGHAALRLPEDWDQHTIEVAGYDRASLRQRRRIGP